MKYPLAPLVVALVLGDSTERELRKTLIAGQGGLGIFFSSPLATIMWILAVVLLLLPVIRTLRGRMTGRPVAPPAAAD
jgi:putative tricarboxylic transport membrane protein